MTRPGRQEARCEALGSALHTEDLQLDASLPDPVPMRHAMAEHGRCVFHVGMTVSDVERSSAFYGALGFDEQDGFLLSAIGADGWAFKEALSDNAVELFGGWTFLA